MKTNSHVRKMMYVVAMLSVILSAFWGDLSSAQADGLLQPNTIVAPGQAILNSPTESMGDRNPTYIWDEVPGATWYYLWVDGPSSNLHKDWYTSTEANCNGSTCSLSNVTPGLVAGTYTWWVQTWNDAGYGPWSDGMTFNPVPGKATLTLPDGTGTKNPTYTWDTVSGATWYYLWVDGPSGNIHQKWYNSTQANCDATTCWVANATPGLSAGAYTWWVQTWNDAGFGLWSTGMAFNVPLPAFAGKVSLGLPTATTLTNNPTYTWNEDLNATWYYLWVDGPSGNIHQKWYTTAQANCNGTTCSVAGATPNLVAGTHTWRVQTWNERGDGPWSDSKTFTPTLPMGTTLASPTGNAGAINPTYTWNAVSNATWYYLWVDGPSGHLFDKWYDSTQANCSGSVCWIANVTPNLVAGTHTWWVQTWNGAGYGPWSDAMTFNPVPGTANLVLPSGTATGNPTYTWSDTPGATWYYLWVDGLSENVAQQWYSSTQANCNGSTCSVSNATPGLASGTHTWWIQTWNNAGYGPWSTGKSFTVSGGSAFNSQFNGSANNWQVDSGSWYFDSGQFYTSKGLTDYWSSISYNNTFSNLDFQAKLWRTGGTDPNCLNVRGSPTPPSPFDSDWDSGYSFCYTNDGDYSVWKSTGGASWSDLQDWTSSAAINTGAAWNVLRVVADGGNLSFYINGTIVWTGTDASLTSGRVGVEMLSDGTAGNQLWIDWATLSVPAGALQITDTVSTDQQALNDDVDTTNTDQTPRKNRD